MVARIVGSDVYWFYSRIGTCPRDVQKWVLESDHLLAVRLAAYGQSCLTRLTGPAMATDKNDRDTMQARFLHALWNSWEASQATGYSDATMAAFRATLLPQEENWLWTSGESLAIECRRIWPEQRNRAEELVQLLRSLPQEPLKKPAALFRSTILDLLGSDAKYLAAGSRKTS